jgi:hypothetical protein
MVFAELWPDSVSCIRVVDRVYARYMSYISAHGHALGTRLPVLLDEEKTKTLHVHGFSDDMISYAGCI